jgi:hypothetical protein
VPLGSVQQIFVDLLSNKQYLSCRYMYNLDSLHNFDLLSNSKG